MARRGISKKRRILTVFACVLAVFFLVFFLKSSSSNFIGRGALFLLRPVIFLNGKFSSFIENNIAILKDRKNLEQENISLRQRIAELEMEESFSKAISEENKKLKSALLLGNGHIFMAAGILLRPGYGIYNGLLIDAGSSGGVKEGMVVTAFGNVLIGYVSDVTPNLSRIKLVSFPGEETNVFLGNRVSAIAVGDGSENMKIELPYDIDVNLGDTVVSLGSGSLFLGIVEKIFKEPANSFQEITFRLPVNIQELRYVYLIK